MSEQFSDASILSQLQNEFILSQERTIQDMRAKNDSLQREVQLLQRTHNSLLSEHSELKAEHNSLREQIQRERDQCTSKHLHMGKIKEKYKSAQLAILQLENLNAALERELNQYRDKYQTLTRDELVKGKTMDMAFMTLKEDYRKVELLLELEK
jgi:chromosome segregation ATPase